MQVHDWIVRRRESARGLSQLDVRNVTPSIRDFTHAVTTRREALAVIAELSRFTPEEGELGAPDLPGLLQACEDASVSSLAALVDDDLSPGSAELFAQLARSSGSPALARDMVVSREQLYRARLLGADAVLLTAAAAAPAELSVFVEICASMHMGAPIEVRDEAELSAAIATAARIVVIPAFAGDRLSLELADRLLPRVPRQIAPIVRGPFERPGDFARLRGRADAIWLCGPLRRAPDARGFLGPLVESAENG